jgi:hypothetical protein
MGCDARLPESSAGTFQLEQEQTESTEAGDRIRHFR